ncbi:MAG TPA: hypothetical protein VK209_04625 [Candidatus Sulfotelmatobacter sp.]|nr:hypothetical protein [Candidatus Sulfotelmatobacter sp.]
MKTWKIIAITGIVLVTIGLVTASAFAYMYGRGYNTPYGANTGITNPFGIFGNMMGAFGGHMGGGMMGNYNYGYGTNTQVSPGQYGTSCPNQNGYIGTPTNNTGIPITITSAVNIAQQYVSSLSNKDLMIDEVEEYTQNFYVLVKEKSTRIGAFELLINKYTGAITPEMGPNMMWNTKYGMMSGNAGTVGGHMGGMMGGLFTGTTTGPMTVTIDQAKTNAQQFLNTNYAGTTVDDVDTFYGYYHVDVLQNSQTYGMLSVNGYTGQVWYHTWHGNFIQSVEL